MNVRIFFLTNETKDVKIETYYQGENNQVLIVPQKGLPYVEHNVEKMISIN